MRIVDVSGNFDTQMTLSGLSRLVNDVDITNDKGQILHLEKGSLTDFLSFPEFLGDIDYEHYNPAAITHDLPIGQFGEKAKVTKDQGYTVTIGWNESAEWFLAMMVYLDNQSLGKPIKLFRKGYFKKSNLQLIKERAKRKLTRQLFYRAVLAWKNIRRLKRVFK